MPLACHWPSTPVLSCGSYQSLDSHYAALRGYASRDWPAKFASRAESKRGRGIGGNVTRSTAVSVLDRRPREDRVRQHAKRTAGPLCRSHMKASPIVVRPHRLHRLPGSCPAHVHVHEFLGVVRGKDRIGPANPRHAIGQSQKLPRFWNGAPGSLS
jgi:hypothetical protein